MRFFTFSENSILDAIWMPTCFHFRSKNHQKSLQKSILEGINFLIDFCIDFLSIFVRLGKPTWNLGHFFVHKRVSNPAGSPLLVGSMFFFGFFCRPGTLSAPFGLDFGWVGARFWKVFGVDFERFLEVFGNKLGLRLVLENLRLLLENLFFRSILLASGSGWAGGVTRSAKIFFQLLR